MTRTRKPKREQQRLKKAKKLGAVKPPTSFFKNCVVGAHYKQISL
ncbi:MAG TPA: hypothetical protein VL099_11925 [Candidatus Binatia bacterium]|nr:hypothetical protein [Candidatus Binatia bacterium]